MQYFREHAVVSLISFSTVSSRDFNQDIGSAKKAAHAGPVFITDRGRPAYVLLTSQYFDKLNTSRPTIVQLLAMPKAGEVDFEPPRAGPLTKPAEFD
jgi:PHD/YefM family antitoxin component YafN of YafNO toxin-antitoxin module